VIRGIAVHTAAYALSAFIITATLIFVIIFLIAGAVLFPFDLAYRAVSGKLSS
jgi:hypothetical protein